MCKERNTPVAVKERANAGVGASGCEKSETLGRAQVEKGARTMEWVCNDRNTPIARMGRSKATNQRLWCAERVKHPCHIGIVTNSRKRANRPS